LEVRRITDGPVGIGTRHTVARKFMGRRIELTNEYVDYVPDKFVTFTAQSGPAYFEVCYLTEPAADGSTKLTCRMQMEQKGLLGLADPLVAKSMKRDFGTNFRHLKALLENQAEHISP
jgi:hypothetical protein